MEKDLDRLIKDEVEKMLHNKIGDIIYKLTTVEKYAESTLSTAEKS